MQFLSLTRNSHKFLLLANYWCINFFITTVAIALRKKCKASIHIKIFFHQQICWYDYTTD